MTEVSADDIRLSQESDMKLSQGTMNFLADLAAHQVPMPVPHTTPLDSSEPVILPIYTTPEMPPAFPFDSGLVTDPATSILTVEKDLGLTQWKGDYGFDLAFLEHQKYKKNHPVCFSSLKNTLIVKDGVKIPFKFVGTSSLRHLRVRVFAVFTSPEYFAIPVKPCHNHFTEATPEFLMCGNLSSTICYNENGRQGIIIPLSTCRDDLGTGLELEEVLTFTCRTSCSVPNSSSGINNRALSLIFLLETHNGQVVGRRAVSLKVSVSPGRDMSTLQRDRKRNRSSNSVGSLGGASLSEMEKKRLKRISGTRKHQIVYCETAYAYDMAKEIARECGYLPDSPRLVGFEPSEEGMVLRPERFCLRTWLQRYGLDQYVKILEELGFGASGRFAHITEEDLNRASILDPCHRKTMMHASRRVLIRTIERS